MSKGISLFSSESLGLFTRMAELLKEFIQSVLENREEDFWKIESANQSYEQIWGMFVLLGET